MATSSRLALGLLMLAGTTAGCSSSVPGIGKLVPVSGRVTADGVPLTTGSLLFEPNAARGNTSPHQPVGEIDGEGRYRLVTQGHAGAPPGWYRVAVVSLEPVDPKNPYAARRSFIDSRYGKTLTSGLEVEVVEAPQPGQYDLPLTKPKQR